MKKILTTLLAVLSFAASFAQERGRIINLTDYSQPVISKMHRVGSRSTAPLPCEGSPKIPVILVQFNNLKFTGAGNSDAETLANFKIFFNGSDEPGVRLGYGGSLASVKDYFVDQSDSIFQPEFTVIGPVTLSEGYEYYGKNNGSSLDVNIGKFRSEACTLAAKKFDVDWDVFDNNGDGIIDFVFFIYAGEGEYAGDIPDPNTIWPHEQVNRFAIQAGETTLSFGGYGLSNELFFGSIDGIGTCCHELSHALGLPDLYDYVGSSFGLDYWDVMDSGCYCKDGKYPCGYSAYERDFMGWKKLVSIPCNEAITLTLNPIESKKGVAYKIASPHNENEYFIIENRQNLGWDTYLCHKSNKLGAAHGLLISHVDYSASSWSGNRLNSDANHQRFTIVPADGHLMSSSNVKTEENMVTYATSLLGDTYPGYYGVTEMTNYSLYMGGRIEMRIDGIKEEEKVITLNLNGGNIEDGISEIAADIHANSTIIDLSGRRVNAGKKGIYIKDGRKFIVK